MSIRFRMSGLAEAATEQRTPEKEVLALQMRAHNAPNYKERRSGIDAALRFLRGKGRTPLWKRITTKLRLKKSDQRVSEPEVKKLEVKSDPGEDKARKTGVHAAARFLRGKPGGKSEIKVGKDVKVAPQRKAMTSGRVYSLKALGKDPTKADR